MNTPGIVQRNPNAATAVVGAGPGALVVWLLGNVAHIQIPGEVAVVISSLLTAAWLAFSQYGLLGVWSRFLRGTTRKP